jgi:hypothetical protein
MVGVLERDLFDPKDGQKRHHPFALAPSCGEKTMNIEQLPVQPHPDHYRKYHRPFDIGELVRKTYYPEHGIFIVLEIRWLEDWGSWEAHVYSQLWGHLDRHSSSVFVGLEKNNVKESK